MIRGFVIILLLIITCKINAQKAINHLNNRSDFEKFSSLPLTNKYGQATAVKLVYDLKTQKLYFINAKYYKYHHEFCTEFLNNDLEPELFNSINYSNSPKQRYLLANINYFEALNTYALDISPVDLMTSDRINFLYQKVSNATFIGPDLHFLVNSGRLKEEKKRLLKSIPIINPSDIYKNLNYQAISEYKNSGILRFVDDLNKEISSLNATDIIVIDQTPVFLPNVAGIMVTAFQTPLSHLSILGQNRKIPIAAYTLAFKDTILRKWENKKINFSVERDDFKIEAVKKVKADQFNKKKIKLKYDLSVNTLIDIADFNKKSFKYAGNKAVNLGILYRISQKANFKTPESAFVIPFYFYHSHVQKSVARGMIDDLLADKDRLSQQDSLKAFLKLIRKEIKLAPIDTALLTSINNKISSLGNFKRMRFRSSTNAEDAKGFSGAGLYTSKTGILDSIDKSVESAIKKVWASLWSFEAFIERDYFKIDHGDAYMAVLVHRSFPNEEVNGVAITKNLYRSGYYGFIVNVQLGEESVVKPKAGVISDQFICYPDQLDNVFADNFTIDIITTSNLNDNKLVMTEEEIQNLANQLEIIKKHFKPNSATIVDYLNFGLDLEFKLDGPNRDLYIKQVRLYND